MSRAVLVEHERTRSCRARRSRFARDLGDVEAVVVGGPTAVAGQRRAHVAEGSTRTRPGPGRRPSRSVDRVQPFAVVAAGTDRGNEVLAHVAARPTCRSPPTATPSRRRPRRHPRPLGRQPARGGAHPRPLPLLTVAPHAVAAAEAPARRRSRRSRRRSSRSGPGRAGRRARRRGRQRHLARRGEGRGQRRPGRRLGRRLRDPRGARRPARRRRRLLARGDQRGLAPAHRPGRPDGHEGLARPLHRLRHQRCDPAHRRLQGREAHPRDQLRRRGADPRQRGLRGDRRPDRDRAGDHRRAPKARVAMPRWPERSRSRRRSRSPAPLRPPAALLWAWCGWASRRALRRPPAPRAQRGGDRARPAQAAQRSARA